MIAKFCILLFLLISISGTSQNCENIFIITTDGYRWQELFNGADPYLISNPDFVSDTSLTKELYWDNDPAQRRKKLMPFVWNYIGKKGQIWGNRNYNNNVSVSNPFRISYPGYNELLKGYVDPGFYSNQMKKNNKSSILNFLNSIPTYKNKVAMIGSWELFSFIESCSENSFPINCGFQNVSTSNLSPTEEIVNYVQHNSTHNGLPTRSDMLTFTLAQEYIKKVHPKVMFIGFGETDEFAHQGRYDDYLNQANLFDKFLADLWSMVQSDPVYKNKTTFFITTDHGRGGGSKWTDHGILTKGSAKTWLIQMGPNIMPLGEVKSKSDIKTSEFAQTIASYLGVHYKADHPIECSSQSLLSTTYMCQYNKP